MLLASPQTLSFLGPCPPFFIDHGHLTLAIASNVSLHSVSGTQLADLCCCPCREVSKPASHPPPTKPKMYFCVFVAGLCWPSSLLSPTPTICCSFILYLLPPVRLPAPPPMPRWPCFFFKSRLESFHHIASPWKDAPPIPPCLWFRFMVLVRPSCHGLWQPLPFPTSDSLLFLRSFKSLMLSL